MVQPLLRMVWQFFKNLIEFNPCDPEIPLLGYISERNENICSQRFDRNAHSRIISNNSKVEVAQMSIHW